MISKLSTTISDWLVRANVIEDDDKELYEFAAYSFIFGLLPAFLTIIYGLIMGLIIEGVLMIVPFMLIRKFSGGYHLKSPTICVFVSSVIIIVALITIKALLKANTFLMLSVVELASTIIIYFLSPIDSDERELSPAEARVFKKIARTLATIFSIVFFILVANNNYSCAIPIGIGSILPAVLQIPCILFKKK